MEGDASTRSALPTEVNIELRSADAAEPSSELLPKFGDVELFDGEAEGEN